MNPQPPEYLGQVFAFLFILVVVYFTVKAMKENKTWTFDDNFILGYVEPNDTHISVINQKPAYDLKLYEDCISALHSIGFKKTQAKKKAKEIFESRDDIRTIQQFLLIALQK